MGAKKELIDLLVYIKEHGHVGVHAIEIISFSLEQELIERNEQGNFKLSDKGADVLRSNTSA